MLGKRLINSNSAAAGGSCTTDTLQILGDTSCVAYYKMSDATDESGSYDGTATNVNFNVAGKFGNAGSFNGSSSKITATGFNITGNRSISFWVKMDSSSSQNTGILSTWNNGSDYLEGITIRGGAASTNFILAVGSVNHTIAALNTNWSHITVVYDGTYYQVYFNGSQVLTDIAVQSGIEQLSNIQLGARHTPTDTQYFNGAIDQVRIFNKALSSSEVTTLYNEVYCQPTIVPTDHFNPVIYTGNAGASNTTSQSITSVGFKPDLVWVKNRDNGNNNVLFDSIRAATNWLNSNNSNQEYSNSSTADASFLSNGFTTGKSDQTNRSGDGIVSWNWKAGGADVLNEEGTIDSQVSANTDAGFSIVSYTGAGSVKTVGHGLSQAPELMFIKNRANKHGAAYHLGVNSTGHLFTTTYGNEPFNSSRNDWFNNNTPPTSSVFTVRSYDGAGNETQNYVGNYTGNNYIAYCFHSVDGYQKVGSYTGTGASGNNIVTGFRPAFVMIKRTDSARSWLIFDSVRGASKELYPDLSDVEYGAGGNALFSTGFSPEGGGGQNVANGTYIYLAIAEEVLVPDNFFNDDSTLATYKLNGDAGDDSGNGYNGTASNITYATGKFDEAAVFNGTTSKIDISSPISTTSDQDFSFSQWVNFDTLPTGGSFIGIWGSDTGAVPTTRLLIRQVSGGYRYEVLRGFNSSYYYNATDMPVSSLSTSVWYNIVFTYTSSTKTVHIYLNGVELGTGYVLSTSGSSAISTGLSMGRYNSTNLYGLDGKLDQVRIFDRVLSSAEVTQLKNE